MTVRSVCSSQSRVTSADTFCYKAYSVDPKVPKGQGLRYNLRQVDADLELRPVLDPAQSLCA
jgi:hypothetical protein